MIPFAYSHRNLRVRWKTTLMTASGFTLVVAALVIMLAFVNGMLAICAVSGEPENVLVLSRGNADEILSRLDRRTVSQVGDDPGVARSRSGHLLVSREIYCPVMQRNDMRELQVRGVEPIALEVHGHIKIIEGQMLRPGRSEIILGRALKQGLGLKLGDTLEIGGKQRHIVGIFSGAGSVFESEVWSDLKELMDQFHRDGSYSSVVLKTANAAAAQTVSQRLSGSRLLPIDAQPEPEYYAQQASQTESLRMPASPWRCSWASEPFLASPIRCSRPSNSGPRTLPCCGCSVSRSAKS